MNIGDIVKITRDALESGFILGYDEDDRYEIVDFQKSILGTDIAILRSVGPDSYMDSMLVNMLERV